MVLPDSGSAYGSNRSSSLANVSSRPGTVYPWRSPLTGAFSYHDFAVGSSSYGTRANQHHTSLDTRPATPMSNSGTHIANAGPSTTEQQMYLATRVEQALNAPTYTEPVVDPNTGTTKNLHTHDQSLHQIPPHPPSGAPQCAPDSQFVPLPSDLACSEGHRGRVPSPFNHFPGRMALPPLESDGTLPISADVNSRIPFPSPASCFDGSGVAHPLCALPSDAVVYHDPAAGSSQRDAPAYRGYTSLDAKYATLVLTAAKIRDDARHATQLVGSRAIADVSTRALAFAEEVNSPIHPAPGDEQRLNAPIGNGGPVHIDTRIAESLLPTYDLPQSQGTPYPTCNAPRDVPGSGYYPLTTFADLGSPSDQVPSPFTRFAGPSATHVRYSSQATTDPCAGEVGALIAPCTATPVSALTRCETSYALDHTPLDNGYTASLWSPAGHEGNRSIIPPQTAYTPFPASSSHAVTFNTLPLSDDTPTRNSAMPSSELANALGGYDTQLSRAPYHGANGAFPLAEPIGSGLVNALTSAPEIVWQTVPGPGPAPVASQTVNAFPAGSSTADAEASCLCADCIGSQTNYVQGVGGCLDAYDPSRSPTILRLDRDYLYSARGQCDDGAYPKAPSSCFPPNPAYPSPGVGKDQFVPYPYSL